MQAIVRTCWRICLLKDGPQVFPHSWLLFAVVLVIYLGVDAAVLFAQGVHGLAVIPQTLCDTGLELIFFVVVLGIWHKLGRFNQTATSLFGTGTIITLAAIPVSFAITLLPHSPVGYMAGVLVYGILAWSILVMGHVTRHALDTGLTIGIVIAAAYTLLNFALFALFFPLKS